MLLNLLLNLNAGSAELLISSIMVGIQVWVWGSGFRVCGFRFGVWGLVLGVWGVRYGVWVLLFYQNVDVQTPVVAYRLAKTRRQNLLGR